MKVTILNGAMPDDSPDFSSYTSQIYSLLHQKHEVYYFDLKQLNLKFCLGCWDCWWKTPGQCSIKDDGEMIFRAVINSDYVLFASPLKYGFTSSELKKITDRLIVLLHPYIKLKNKECHHKKRYAKYPNMGVLVQREEDTDEEDLRIIKDIYDRMSINLHSEIVHFNITDQQTPETIANEISHL